MMIMMMMTMTMLLRLRLLRLRLLSGVVVVGLSWVVEAAAGLVVGRRQLDTDISIMAIWIVEWR